MIECFYQLPYQLIICFPYWNNYINFGMPVGIYMQKYKFRGEINMADYMKTFSKVNFSPLLPNKDNILIDDIAHALSLMCRANGHFPEFYSVAQHSIFCCEEAIQRGYSNKIALACLLHDASEAYIADITRPVKKYLNKYLEIEMLLQNEIYEKYLKAKLTDEEQKMIDSVDNTLLYHEFIHYTGIELEVEKSDLLSKPVFKFEEFASVENRYKELFYKLTNIDN